MKVWMVLHSRVFSKSITITAHTGFCGKGRTMVQIRHWQFTCFVLAAGLLLSAVQSSEAAPVTWRKDFRSAVQESKKSQKPLLIEFTASWCGYCKKMERSYADEHVSRHLKNCFIPVVVDADENERLVASVGVEALPTTVIVSPELKILKRITGYKTPKQLEKDLGELCRKTHQKQTPRVVARINSPVARNIAYDNYCLVSLLEQRLLKQGNPGHTSTYDGNVVCFASAQHKQHFDANPEKYWPVMAGRCPVTAVEKGIEHAGLPEFGAVYHGRLWFFADEAHRERFARGPERYVPVRTR